MSPDETYIDLVVLRRLECIDGALVGGNQNLRGFLRYDGKDFTAGLKKTTRQHLRTAQENAAPDGSIDLEIFDPAGRQFIPGF
jgi:hypothetical protein